MSVQSKEAIRKGLKEYADRGVFRGFGEKETKDGRIEFTFNFLHPKPMTIEYIDKESTIIVKNMLPSVPPDMYSGLAEFVEKLYDRKLPEHRRINPKFAEVKCTNNRKKFSIVMKVLGNKHHYGVKKVVNLASWIHTHIQAYYPDYLVEVLGEPQE